MIRLRKGIFLEKSNELLPWASSRDQAWNIGKPLPNNLIDKSDRTRLRWEDSILDGLECSILAYLPDERNSLREVTVYMGHTVHPDPFQTYVKVFGHLAARIGPPRIVTRTPQPYGPVLIWKHQGCSIGISIYERYGEGFEMRVVKLGWFNWFS